MKKLSLLLAAGLLSATCFSQNASFNQNASRSNHTRFQSGSWQFDASTGASFGLGSDKEKALFRGNSLATKMSGRYQFGAMGLGMSFGLIPGKISNSALNEFLSDRKIDPAQAAVNSTSPSNTFLLAGPTFLAGNKVKLLASLQGGIFLNNPGSLSITPNGQTRAIYRFDQGKHSIQPGLSGSLQLQYPVSRETRFFIGTDYLFTKTSIKLVDLQSGIDNASEQSRNTQLFTASLGITRGFGNEAPAQRKKHIGNVKYEELSRSPRDISTGQASGRRIDNTSSIPESAASGGSVLPAEYQQPPASTREAGSGLATGRRSRSMESSCGPVTRKITHPDGTIEENSFACPEDALSFENARQGMPNRISMNVTTTRQTQGKTFGEKVQSGLNSAAGAVANGLRKEGVVHRDLAARQVLWGKITTGQSAFGILTNEHAEQSTVNVAPVTTILYSREAGSGIATGKRSSREAGSGIATGRRQYQPLYHSDNGPACNPCEVKVESNPLYNPPGSGGNNPLHQPKDRTAGPGKSSIAGSNILVSLFDLNSGSLIASTSVGENGEFWFANLPDGPCELRFSGTITYQKQFDVAVENTTHDLAGQLLLGNQTWSVEYQLIADTLVSSAGPAYIQKMLAKTGSSKNHSTLIWSPRSNFMASPSGQENTLPEITLGSDNGSSALRPGNPIKGVVVKGGRNPVDQVLLRTTTNEFGEFEWTDLSPGRYQLNIEQSLPVEDAVVIGVEPAGESKAFNQNASRSNNIASREEDMSAPQTRAQNNNTVRSNRGEFKSILIEADKDGDGEYETDLSVSHAYTMVIDEQGGSTTPVQKAGISTSRSNIRNKSALQSATGDLFIAYGTTIIDGKEVNTRSVLKTKHDTVKNSISNIR